MHIDRSIARAAQTASLLVLSAFALPIVGLERMQAMAEWGAGLDAMALRFVAAVAIGIGAFMIYSVSSPRSER